MATRSASKQPVTRPAHPALDESHVIVLTGFRRRDLEIGFCTDQQGCGAVFIDRSKTWLPDSSSDRAAECEPCKASHWLIDFNTAIGEGRLDLTDGSVVLGFSELVAASLSEGPSFPR